MTQWPHATAEDPRPRGALLTKQPTSLSCPGASGLLLTRRPFFTAWPAWPVGRRGRRGRWAAGRSNDDDALKTLKVPEGAVTAQTPWKDGKTTRNAVTLAGSAKLPFGTRLVQRRRRRRLLTSRKPPGPWPRWGCSIWSPARCTAILEHAVGEAEGFEDFDIARQCRRRRWTRGRHFGQPLARVRGAAFRHDIGRATTVTRAT